jgi:hypothetical protein
MRYKSNLAVAVFAGAAMIGVAACAPTTHVTETTTTRQYDTTAPPMLAPVASSNNAAARLYAGATKHHYGNFESG